MSEASTVAISGASGLVGRALTQQLRAAGHRVRVLTRGARSDPDAIAWDPMRGTIDAAQLEGVDAIVHLAGENVAGGRWSDARMARIRDSRVRGTRLLADTIAKLERKPRAFICASAVGLFGDRGDQLVDENSAPGHGFLADVCKEWEAAALPAHVAGVRVVWARFGIVLAQHGGALARMLLPFRLGLGGTLGSGRQWMSWITLDDVIAVITRAITNDTMRGAYNVVAPHPVTNADFTRTLARVLHRPSFLPVPAFALRLLFGRMADEALLASQRAAPRRLVEDGFAFAWPDLEPALRHVLSEAVKKSPASGEFFTAEPTR